MGKPFSSVELLDRVEQLVREAVSK